MPEGFLFVSHVSEDRPAAMEVVEELERRGVRCWIAPRNVRPGRPFDDEIANAIEACQAMLLIFSERCNDSEYIRREVTVAGESHKVVIPFRIENAEPKHGLRVRLSDLHWLDGFASREQAIDELVGIFPAAKEPAIRQAGAEQAPLGERETPAVAETASVETTRHAEGEKPQRSSARPQRLLPLALTAIACLILAVIGIWAYPLISAYIKSNTTTQVAVQPAPIAQPTPPVLPTRQPTPTPQPSPQTAPPPPLFSSADCKRETASFYDNFQKIDPRWSWDVGAASHYANGEMAVVPPPTLRTSARYRALFYQNATICAHIKSPSQVTDPNATSGGVMFWEAALGNFYVVEITPGGDYSILRRLADKWITVVPRTPNQQINRGADAVNEIRVELVDNFGALFINNVKVQEFRGQPEIGGGTIGLYASSEPTVSDEWRFVDVAVVDNGKAKPVVLPPSPSGPTIPDCRPTNPTDFQDTFTKQDPAWGIGSNDTTVQYVDGQLLIKTRETTYRLLLYLPLVFKNATVCATVKSPPEVADLKANAQGALAFWASDYSNFYTASIYPNGAFFVSRRVHGNLAAVVPWTTSDAIKKGVDAINLLQVVLKGTSASLYINGIKVTDFQGQPPPEGGATGLVAVSEAQQRDEWRFLNITVVENQ